MRRSNCIHRQATWLAAALILAVTFGIYWSGLTGSFLFDDRINILVNPAVQPDRLTVETLRAAWFGNHSGPLGRPISSVSFALNYLTGGLDPWGFKLTNLILHLLCGGVLFGALHRLLQAGQASGQISGGKERNRWLALLATAFWLLHPLHVSTVLYVVQRMAILASLFSFLGVWAYVNGRSLQLQGRTGWFWLLVAMPACTALAALSKENGLLTPLLCIVCEYCFLRLAAHRPWDRRLLRGLYGASAAIGLGFMLMHLSTISNVIVGGYADRPFTLSQRLLTEARVLWWYLRLLVAPDLAEMNLYHDDFPVSTGLFAPWTTAAAVGGWVIAGTSALMLAKRYPLATFAVLFFLAGHLLESSVVPLEMIFEHRNYLPSAGVFLLAAHALFQLASLRRSLAVGLTLLLLTISSLQLAERSLVFSDTFQLVLHSLRYHPDSVRSQLWAGEAYKHFATQIPDDERKAQFLTAAAGHFRKAAELEPTDTIGLLEVLTWQAGKGEPLEPAVYEELVRRMSRPPVHASTIVSFQELVRNIIDGSVRFPIEVALTLLGHLERSPGLWSEHRGAVVEAIGALRWQQGQHDEAARLYDQAQELRPGDAYLALNRAATHLALEQPEAARKALQLARRLDLGELTTGLDLLEADIAAAEHRSGSLSSLPVPSDSPR